MKSKSKTEKAEAKPVVWYLSHGVWDVEIGVAGVRFEIEVSKDWLAGTAYAWTRNGTLCAPLLWIWIRLVTE